MNHPAPDFHPFRATVAVIALFAGIAGMIGLYLADIPDGNRPPLLVALGVVLGWGTSVIQSEFGSVPTGPKAPPHHDLTKLDDYRPKEGSDKK